MNLDSEARSFLMKRGVTGVPSFLIGDDMVVGLDKEKVLALTDHRLHTCNNCGTKLRAPVGKGKIKLTCPKCKNVFFATT